MKLLIITCFLVIFANVVLSESLTQIALKGRKIPTGWTYCSRNASLQLRCSDDCESLEYCMNGRVMTIKCSTQTQKKYCNVDTFKCSDEINVCYNSRDFCPHDGVFPDLTNCQRYVSCEGDVMRPYECMYGTKWNYKTGYCEEDVPCQTYTYETGCAGTNWNSIVPHYNPRWFVFCYFGRPLLGECSGRNYTFDRNTGNCRFQCEHRELTRNMKIADERNESVYYDCYRVQGKWQTIEKTCPSGTVFSQTNQACIKSSISWPEEIYPHPEVPVEPEYNYQL